MAIAVLGMLGLVLIAACALLTVLTLDFRASRYGAAPALAIACGLLGVLVARRQPRNPEGWLLPGSGWASSPRSTAACTRCSTTASAGAARCPMR